MRLKQACLLPLLAACGSVDSADSLGDPLITVTATLEQAPPATLHPERLRATLVWVNGLPSSRHGYRWCVGDTPQELRECELTKRKEVQVSASDIEVRTQFPLTVRLATYDLPTPLTHTVEDPTLGASVTYSSLPEAEVVLYEDGNGNGKLDLLPLGQPGPGPDRVVALSSGLMPDRTAMRTSVVYKRGKLTPDNSAYRSLLHAINGTQREGPSEDAPDGVYALRQTAGAGNALVQDLLLRKHTLLSAGQFDEAFYQSMKYEVEPIQTATVRLFPVAEERPSWLSRACEPLFKLELMSASQPPPGADVQCGRAGLHYASHRGNYCGQTAQIDLLPWTFENAAPPSWWPCDAQGLIAGTPYQAPRARLDDDAAAVRRRTRIDLSGPSASGAPVDFVCRQGNIYHFDEEPDFRMPTVPIEPGSQVMCRSRDSLSYIPPRADGCMFKYSYELASNPAWLGVRSSTSWDMRGSPPSWWPCDDSGQLKLGTTYVPPQSIATADCADSTVPQPMETPPPEGSRIACDGALRFTFMPPWSDPCDGKRAVAARWGDDATGAWSHGPGELLTSYPWWPCDKDGQLRPESGFLPMGDN